MLIIMKKNGKKIYLDFDSLRQDLSEGESCAHGRVG